MFVCECVCVVCVWVTCSRAYRNKHHRSAPTHTHTHVKGLCNRTCPMSALSIHSTQTHSDSHNNFRCSTSEFALRIRFENRLHALRVDALSHLSKGFSVRAFPPPHPPHSPSRLIDNYCADGAQIPEGCEPPMRIEIEYLLCCCAGELFVAKHGL